MSSNAGGAILTTERPHARATMSALLPQLLQISAATKKNPVHVALDYLRVVGGPGKLSPADFMLLRLFDQELYKGVERRNFVGERYHRDLCYSINYRHDWLGVLENKISSVSYLNAYGLPTIRVEGIYAPYMKGGGSQVLRDGPALTEFLRRSEVYPLFGKPVEGFNSLGSIGLVGYSPDTKEAVATDGRRIRIEELSSEIEEHYSAGYLFQTLAAPERTISQMCGPRLATVRFVTIAAEGGAEIFRVVWKIPSGSNIADNYWRPGNLLAHVDMESGRVRRVVSGKGFEMQEHAEHPDTGVELIGFAHPQWDAMKALALEGARLMRHVPFIGWDIACTDAGPVVVEMNEHPDAFLMQFAERRGILDEQFRDFVAFQKRNRDAFQADVNKRSASL